MADEIINEQQEEITIEPPTTFNFEGISEKDIVEPDVIEEEPIEEEKAVEVPLEEASKEKVAEALKPLSEPIAEKIKFANEASENIYNLLVEGKDDEVLSILNEQKKLKEVDKLAPSEIIKLNLQYQNKDFTSSEINDLFNETYEIPEVPEQELTETDEEFEKRTASYEKDLKKVESRMARDAKPAITDLQQQLKNIVLPSTKVEPIAKVPTQEELAAYQEANNKFLKEVSEGVQQFDGYSTTFKDEEVEIPVAYKLSKEEKAQIEPLVALSNSDAGAFLQGIGWLDENGNVNTKKITQDLPLILNKEKVFEKIASETGNKRHEASIKSIKNIDYSGNKNSVNVSSKTNAELQRDFATHFFQNS